MSRYCGEFDAEPILKAAEHWRTECLLKDGAIFSSNPLWTREHFQQVEQHYVSRLEEGEDFFQKLEFQLAPAPPGKHRSRLRSKAAKRRWQTGCRSTIGPSL